MVVGLTAKRFGHNIPRFYRRGQYAQGVQRGSYGVPSGSQNASFLNDGAKMTFNRSLCTQLKKTKNIISIIFSSIRFRLQTLLRFQRRSP